MKLLFLNLIGKTKYKLNDYIATLKNELGKGKGNIIFCKSTYIIYIQIYQHTQLRKNKITFRTRKYTNK